MALHRKHVDWAGLPVAGRAYEIFQPVERACAYPEQRYATRTNYFISELR
jgi:hypothetical protein